MTMAAHNLSARTLDVQAEWALSVALQTMTMSALDGMSSRRTQAVVDHLEAAATEKSISLELRLACDKLADVWRTIDLT